MLSIIDDKNIIQRLEMMENMDSSDIAKIRAFHEQFDHGPKMEYPYECEKCGATGVAPVPFRLDMFLPYGSSFKRYFGKAS